MYCSAKFEKNYSSVPLRNVQLFLKCYGGGGEEKGVKCHLKNQLGDGQIFKLEHSKSAEKM
jgi:hypothetical protein